MARGPASRGRRAGRRRRAPWIAVAAAVAVVLLLRTFVLDTYAVTSDSMSPSLLAGQRWLVVRVGGVERGDVVVFHGSTRWGEPGQDYVKRVIGLPGDHIVCCSDTGDVIRNGVDLPEPYASAGTPAGRLAYDVTVPDDRLWVLGDNRDHSGDSRSYLGRPGGGFVPFADLVGRVSLRYWPW